MLGRTVAHYRITDRLGGGGMGVVYKAEDLKLGRTVALKFLSPELTRDPDAKRRFTREARAASLLDHPNICTIYDFGETDDEQVFIAMACYDGESLQERIRRGPLPFHEALKVFEQIARGLAKAHASGVVHRDIKPGNVMITNDGVVKIVDFGLAKLSGATILTRSRNVMGTAAYMAPEQLRGEDVNAPADIWALGVLLYELLAGRHPFRGNREEGFAYSILNEPPAPIDAGPEAAPIEPVIRRMLRKDPLQRYQSIDALLADLAPFLTAASKPSGSGPRTAPAAERQRLVGGARLGPYAIVRPIGSGGMGDVYLAKDVRLDRDVAIKVLAPEFVGDAKQKERFKREAKAISSLNHANVCMLFDVGEDDGIEYLVMEYIEGETLAERLSRGALPAHQMLLFGRQISDALDRAHRQGIVHRDLKPGNVMITAAGSVKLLDFGLAKENAPILASARERRDPSENETVRRSEDEPTLLRDATPPPKADRPLTAEGTIVGTIAYMAPEQIEGHPVDARSDIFSLGAILYEMATGKRAFEGKTRASLIAAILERDPAPLAELQPAQPRTLDHVIAKCLEKDPDARWQSARDVATELQWIEQNADERKNVQVGRGRREWIAIAAAVVLTLVAAALAFAVYRSRPEQPLRHLAIALPDGSPLGFVGAATAFDVSRDGTSLVFDSHRQLYLRRLDDGSVTPIPGTENAIDPFFSPDGRSVGFEADSKLKRVLLSGGTPAEICPAENVRGAAWGEDGTIVFGTYGSLMRVAASGGKPVPLTEPRQGEQSHRFPQFLPDGRHVIFTIMSKVRSEHALGVVDVSTHQRTNLPVRGYFGRFSSGRLFFARDQTLFAAPFDVKTLKLTGDPAPLPEPVELYTFAAIAHLAFAGDGSLFYLPPQPPADTQLVIVGATGGATPIGTMHGAFDSSSISNERKQLVTALYPASDPYSPQMWTCDLPAGACSSIGPGGGPVWSPDGKMIAYTCIDRGADDSTRTICVMKPGGGAPTRVLDHGKENWFWPVAAAWTPDSRSIVFLQQRMQTGWDIYRWDLDRGDRASDATSAVVKGPHNEINAALSPDGRWLAFQDADENQAYVTTFADAVRRWPVPHLPLWSRDSKHVFYLEDRNFIERDLVPGESFELGPPRTLFQTDVDVTGVIGDGQYVGIQTIRAADPRKVIAVIEGFAQHLR